MKSKLPPKLEVESPSTRSEDRPLRAKIEDESLRAFAASDDSTLRSVIVELAMTPIEPLRPWGKKPPRREDVLSAKPSSPMAGAKSLMDRLGRDLSKLTNDVVRINAANAFVLSINSEQLRQIDKMELVGAVRPNRTHSRPHAAGA